MQEVQNKASKKIILYADLSDKQLLALWQDRNDVHARDIRLLRLWAEGDKDSGLELVGFYRGFIYSICKKYGITAEDDFNEVYQNLFTALLERLPELPTLVRKSFAGFLAWRMKKAILDHWKITRSEQSEIEDPSVKSHEEAIEKFEIISRCRDKLPPVEKLIFDLRFSQEMTNKEIAKQLNRKAEAVGQRVFQLCKKMRTCLNRLLCL